MKTTWADEKMEQLMSKPESEWDIDDWEAYHYIQQFRFESGYYDD